MLVHLKMLVCPKILKVGGDVLAIEDDLIQFWCGNMVTLAAMILCIGYLAYGMDFE